MERRDFINEQREIAKAKVEIAEAGLTSMLVGWVLLWALLIVIVIVL